MMDEDQTVHVYGLDGLGRTVTDSVAVGIGVDATVQQVARLRGSRYVQDVKSYGSPGGTSR